MPATTQSGPARANVNRSHKYHRPAANAAGKQVGPSSDNLGGHRVSDNDGPAKRECGLICHMAYITM